MKSILFSLSFLIVARFVIAQQIQATCTQQTATSFTNAMDLGADAIHLNVKFDNKTPKLSSGNLLSDMVKKIEWHTKSYTRYEVKYIINLSQSVHYKEEAKLLYELLDSYISMDRVTIRSADFKTIKYWHEAFPNLKYELLENKKKSVQTNLANLSFKPYAYGISQNNGQLEKQISTLQKQEILTSISHINDTISMKNMTKLRINFIVTDSIGLANQLGVTRKVELPMKND